MDGTGTSQFQCRAFLCISCDSTQRRSRCPPPQVPRGGKFRVKTQHNGGRLPITNGATKAGAKGRKRQGKQPGSQQQGGQKLPRRKKQKQKQKQQQQQGKLLGQQGGGVHKK